MPNVIKSLTEQRDELNGQLQGIIATAKAEVRSMTEEEINSFNAIETEINSIDQTLEAEKRATKLAVKASTDAPQGDDSGEDENEELNAEERSFVDYIKANAGGVPSAEYRAANVTMSENGAVIPQKTADRIISAVTEMCPILNGVTMFSVKGTLKIPVWGKTDSGDNITVGYQEEFNELTANSGKFTSVDLTGYLAGALTLIGVSVITNSDVDILNFIITEMAKEIAKFLEKELLIGTSGKAQGAIETTNVHEVTSASPTADVFIELQAKVPTIYQQNACWTMHPTTFTAAKKLKDGAGQYIMQNNMTLVNGFPYTILGKPVYLSDNMPKYEGGSVPVLYGDYAALGVNMRQNIDIQVLKEKYATQHAVGVVAWFEFDSKIIDHQKIAALKVTTA